MAGNITDYLENALIDLIFRGQAISLPASIYVGLFTALPSDTGGGTEVSGGSYARVAVTRSLANFAGTQSAGSTAASSGTGGATSNNATITFPAPTAAWGTITGAAIFDAASGGNMLITLPLAASKAVNSGDQAPIISAGALTFSLD
jgi:hypothetical protein